MKQFLLSLTLIVVCAGLQAQQPVHCGTMPVHELHKNNPQNLAGIIQAQTAAREWRENHAAQMRGGNPAILTIPVVVHVLYKNAAQNITDQQIQSQISVLNEDYRALNANISSLPAIFDTIAADVEIEFCLANFDPNGNPTNGITRTSTQGGQFLGYFNPFTEDAKFDSTGGKNAWPTDQYLNIWVCELFPGLLGYAQFPGDVGATDGVVVTYTAFGTIGTVTAPSTLGRTATHEVGHWLGLYHIWGDDNDCTTGSDSIPDTPNAASESQSDCQITRNSCSNEDPWWGVIDPPDMVQNYMDYSNDSCMAMFTLGQKARMLSFLNSDPRRAALFSSPAGCAPQGVQQHQYQFGDYFSLYPNPTNGIVNVSYFGNEAAQMNIEVLDLNGRVVGAFTTTDYSYTLDLSNLPAGVYAVRFSNADRAAVKQLIIN
jgi:hypothetical protein